MADDSRALVLGGGGITGIAWELGLIARLAEGGIDLAGADAPDVVVGTSAGSSVAVQLGSGRPVDQLYAAQLAAPTGERAAAMPLSVMLRFVAAGLSSRNERTARARLGRMAIRARTVPVEERMAIIRSRLPSTEWPARPRLLISAVDAESGEFRVFDSESGVSLPDAVAASCAVPLVWPPVPIGDRLYVDGGVRSPANVALAAGSHRVLVIAPMDQAFRRSGRPGHQLRALGPSTRGLLITPTTQARQEMGRNPLDPAFRAAAARAGFAQGAEVLGATRSLWTG